MQRVKIFFCKALIFLVNAGLALVVACIGSFYGFMMCCFIGYLENPWAFSNFINLSILAFGIALSIYIFNLYFQS